MQQGDRVYFPMPCPEGYPPEKWVGQVYGYLFGKMTEGEGWLVDIATETDWLFSHDAVPVVPLRRLVIAQPHQFILVDSPEYKEIFGA